MEKISLKNKIEYKLQLWDESVYFVNYRAALKLSDNLERQMCNSIFSPSNALFQVPNIAQLIVLNT